MVCFLILAVWTQVCLSCWQTVYFHSQLSLITSLDLFPLLVWFVCSYSARINKTFKSLPLNTLNVGVQLKWRQVWEYENGGRYERHQSEQGVQQEDVQTALCPQNLETPKIYITCLGRDGILTNFLISIWLLLRSVRHRLAVNLMTFKWRSRIA